MRRLRSGGLILLLMVLLPASLAAQDETSSFSDVNEPDWTTNVILYIVLLVLMGVVYVWRHKAFEGAVRAACDGKAVSLRSAYNTFLVWVGAAGLFSLAVVIASTFLNLRSLLMPA